MGHYWRWTVLIGWIASEAQSTGMSKLGFYNADWPPFSMVSGSQPGYVKEIVSLCAPKAGVDIYFKRMPVRRMIDALKSGDLALNVMSFKPERESYLIYGKQPLFRNRYVFVRSTSHKPMPEKLSDLETYRLGHLRGLKITPSYTDYLEGRVIHYSNSTPSLLKMLTHGRIDGFISSLTQITFLNQSLGLPLEYSTWVLREGTYYIAASKKALPGDAGKILIQSFDACLGDLHGDGTLERLKAKYQI